MDLNNMSINTTAPSVIVAEESVFMDSILVFGHLVCAFSGIPLNVTIICFIIFRRRLRRQPRILMWIGIGFSNIFFLLTNILEPIGYYYSTKDTELCRIYFFLVGFPGAAFLMFNFLSLVDRYLSVFHSIWYRRCVTVRLMLGIQLGAFIILFFLMKSHYVFGIIQVNCKIHPLDRTFYISFIVIFLVLCLSGQLTLYILIKKHLVQPISTIQEDDTNGVHNTTTKGRPAKISRLIQPHHDFNRSRSTTDNIEEVILPQQAVKTLGQRVDSNKVIKMDLHFVRIKYQIVSRLELEATRNVVCSVGIFLLFSLPWIISSILAHICNENTIHKGNSDEEEIGEAQVEQCSPYYWAISYTRLIYLIGHFLHQLFCFVSRSKEFCAGLVQAHTGRRNRSLKTRNSTEL